MMGSQLYCMCSPTIFCEFESLLELSQSLKVMPESDEASKESTKEVVTLLHAVFINEALQ